MKIDFEFTTAYGKFSDALHLPDDHDLSEAELNIMKQERLNNWISAITAPQAEFIVEPTSEEL